MISGYHTQRVCHAMESARLTNMGFDHSYIPLQFTPPKIVTVFFPQQTYDTSEFIQCESNGVHVLIIAVM